MKRLNPKLNIVCGTPRLVPPSPEIIAAIRNEFVRKWKGTGITFHQFLMANGYQNPAHDLHGMDDNFASRIGDAGPELIELPKTALTGDVNVMVLLVDFPDLEGKLSRDHYEELLFSEGTYITGSMADYYSEVSRGKVRVRGNVHGWFRMPRNYSYYTNGNSGLLDKYNKEHYPRDARRLAEDAIDVALAEGVSFPPALDALNNGTVAALFIVHAGRGAEKLAPILRGNHIWSHKWALKKPKKVNQDLWATTYLTVPQEALLGVCVHELGHLAFQWQDFYDPNYDQDGDHWDGNGMWDVMASGSYAGRELRPVHPAGFHKTFHKWIEVEEIGASVKGVQIHPVTRENGKVIKVRSNRYKKGQYLILENREKSLFDGDLPGEGLLVWRVDESAEQEGSRTPGMYLLQADGRHDLLNADDGNQGDPGDPFPGSAARTSLGETGEVSTSFPDEGPSGVTFSNIGHDPVSKVISLDISIA
ncbi:MAG: M6 family metalloprotease domain-containing protein [Candidatus Hydrogenedentes bacterium]|nr:M6 family metalloprotease domain-containing protein [Candidatus Hydrogenedentota bacterium]